MKLKLNVKSKIVILIAAICTAVIALTVILVAVLTPKIPEKETVVTVDGAAVSYGEFTLLAENLRSEVVTYFYSTHHINEGIDFWDKETAFNGESPVEKLKELTINTATQIKVEQQLMVEYDVIEKADTTYEAFKKLLDEENARRAEIIAKGGEVYGPQQYTASGYYEYLRNIRLQALREAIFEKSASENAEDRFGDKLLNELLEERIEKSKVEKNDSVYEKIDSFS